LKPRVHEDRLRELLKGDVEDQEKQDLAFDALVALHSNSSKDHVIKELRETIKNAEEKRPYITGHPRVTLEARKDLKDAWEKATPGPWGVWASQPAVMICRGGDPEKPIASIDTWTGKGVFDADAMVLSREYVPKLLEELESHERHEYLRWRIITKTTPSGKAMFVCLSCGRTSISPDKTCPAPVTIATGGSVPAETLDCETAYYRRPR